MMKTKTYFFRLLAFSVVPVLCLFGLFFAKPNLFYYRAWEYHEDLGFRNAALNHWQGDEHGDMGRKNLFYYQYKKETNVTTDAYGFRTNSTQEQPYEIAVIGWSQIWGSGVGDSATLPWQLAEIMQRPVFNAARTSIFNSLKRADLASVDLVIDCVSERALGRVDGKEVTHQFYQYRNQPLMPIVHYQNAMNSPQISGLAYSPIEHLKLLFSVPPERWMFRFTRQVSRLTQDLLVFLQGGPRPRLFRFFSKSKADLHASISYAKKRAKFVRALGKSYVFIPLPTKQTIYAHDEQVQDSTDDFTQNLISTLEQELSKENIDMINLVPVFQKHAEKSLFLPYDIHWDEYGLHLAAKTIARELTQRKLLPPSRNPK